MSKTYAIKEMHYTLQGEGAQSGRPAVFVRFSGCNLWSGLEKDRSTAMCQFCDTEFHGTDGHLGGKYTAAELVARIKSLWPPDVSTRPYIVCTGGEPMLQVNNELVEAFHVADIEIGMETNGTIAIDLPLDWVCVSPKARTELMVRSGNELKIAYPQGGINPLDFTGMAFDHYFIQPMDGPDIVRNTELSVEFCMEHPQWKLSLQSHKLLDIP